MNINQFAPKNVNLADITKKAKTYAGTLSELKGLYDAGDVILTVENDGTITGFWIESHCENQMLDTLSGYNFNSVYCCKPTMLWLEIILNNKNMVIDEVAGTYSIDGVNYPIPGYAHRTASEVAETLPTEIEIASDKLSSVDFASVRKYLKGKYHYCLAKGEQPTIETLGDVVKVSNISWGRKMTEAEVAAC